MVRCNSRNVYLLLEAHVEKNAVFDFEIEATQTAHESLMYFQSGE